jgi:hypothetical protein
MPSGKDFPEEVELWMSSSDLARSAPTALNASFPTTVPPHEQTHGDLGLDASGNGRRCVQDLAKLLAIRT